MRTTVTLDPDTEELVRTLMSERGLTFKAAINEAIRGGLRRSGTRPFRQKTFDMGLRPGVELTKALAIAAELEDQEIIAKMQRGR